MTEATVRTVLRLVGTLVVFAGVCMLAQTMLVLGTIYAMRAGDPSRAGLPFFSALSEIGVWALLGACGIALYGLSPRLAARIVAEPGCAPGRPPPQRPAGPGS